jgi:cytochrome c biogenesis protein CcdA
LILYFLGLEFLEPSQILDTSPPQRRNRRQVCPLGMKHVVTWNKCIGNVLAHVELLFLINDLVLILMYCIGGVIVSVLASSAVDRGFDPRSGQTKNYKIGICCFSSKHLALKIKSNN